MPDVGTIAATIDPADQQGQKVTARYASMPINYSDFGLKTITMTFGGSTRYVYYQPIEFFFNAEGISAPGANATTPNKIIYWRQIAASEGFNSQATTFIYDGKNDCRLGTSNTIGYYEWEHIGTDLSIDRIYIYGRGARAVYLFIETLHHENGHRQSLHSPAIEGGWGDPFVYSTDNDNDGDYIHDDFEKTAAAIAFRFSVDVDNKALKNPWDHAQWDSTSGKGKCSRNEAQVGAIKSRLEQADWSNVGIYYKH